MKIAVFLFLILSSFALTAQPLWMRYTSISPNGDYILFSYQADLYKVKAEGGTAIPLTQFEGRDFMPIWSPDGKKIAFALIVNNDNLSNNYLVKRMETVFNTMARY